jgi:hypothetical protein
MNSVFLAVAAVMTIGAIQFVLWPAARRTGTSGGRWHQGSLFAIVLIPVIAFGVYAATGNPAAVGAEPGPQQNASGQASPAGSMPTKAVASIGSLVDGLAERLQRKPDDGPGWLLLARSYQHLERREDAAEAYARAKELGMSEPQLEVYLANGATAETGSAAIRGRVSIADDLRGDIAGDATVFIIARAEAGPPAPLAVLRTTIDQLPYTFAISDANAMIKTMPLSAADSIVITAKISTTGEALNTIPGLEATSVPVAMGSAGFLELEIAR